MRVLIDANIYFSYLPIPVGDRDPNVIVDDALTGTFVPLLAPELIDELRRKVSAKRYLDERFAAGDLARFLASLEVIGQTLPALNSVPPSVGRIVKTTISSPMRWMRGLTSLSPEMTTSFQLAM